MKLITALLLTTCIIANAQINTGTANDGDVPAWDGTNKTWKIVSPVSEVAQPFQIIGVAQSATTATAVSGTAAVFRTGDTVLGGADLAPTRSTGSVKLEVLGNLVSGDGNHTLTALALRSAILGGNAITVTQPDTTAVQRLQFKDVSGSAPSVEALKAFLFNDGGELFTMDGEGNVTQLSSHPDFAYKILVECGAMAEWKLELPVKPRINYTTNGDKGLIEFNGRTISLDCNRWNLHDESTGAVIDSGTFE